MKKTLAILASVIVGVSSAANATTYTYVGSNDGWFEEVANWNDANGNTPEARTDGNYTHCITSAAIDGSTFVIDNGKTVKLGDNIYNLSGANVLVNNGSITTSYSGGTLIKANKITIGSAGSVTFGNDTKFISTVEVDTQTGLSFGNTWWDQGSFNYGTATFDLKDNGKVTYSQLMYKDNEVSSSSFITLAANLTSAVLNAHAASNNGALGIFERELIKIDSFKSTTTANMESAVSKMSSAITLNNTSISGLKAETTLSDASVLTESMLGQWALAYKEGSDGTGSIVLRYVTPEPTTATLSLLALAGLAARRRRH